MGKLYRNFQNRILSNHYLNHWVILFMDVVLSYLASLLTFAFIWRLSKFSFSDISFWKITVTVILASLISFALCRTHRNIIRHTSLKSIWIISLAAVLKVALVAGMFVLRSPYVNPIPENYLFVGGIFDLLLTTVFLVGVRVLMLIGYDMVITRLNGASQKRVLVYGFTDKSIALKLRLLKSPHYKVVGFINHSRNLKSLRLADSSSWYFKDRREFEGIVRRYGIDGILFATASDAKAEADGIIAWSGDGNRLKIFMAPEVDEYGGDETLFASRIRQVRIEDLLGREEININREEILCEVRGKTVMVTGGAGSIGSELCRQLATLEIGKLIIFDNAETPTHRIRLELERKFPNLEFVPFIGDVRVPERIETAFERFHPQIVFHAAAYKHVPLMEENPCEAVFVNVIGTRNLADACVKYGVEKMVMVSTDKAVNPTNVMGCSKRLAEIYCQSLGLAIQEGSREGVTKFVTTRFGNVLGSNGSVIPLFREQIASGGPVTVTDPRINRFFMTIPEACRLVLEAAAMSRNTRIFVFDMGEPVRIVDLARRMIRLSGFEPDKDIKIVFTGLRPGEKLYEEVLNDGENTIPTDHGKIRIAKVREYDYDDVCGVFTVFDRLSRCGDKMATVRAMKQLVPEFKSNNSEFEVLDRELEALGTDGGGYVKLQTRK